MALRHEAPHRRRCPQRVGAYSGEHGGQCQRRHPSVSPGEWRRIRGVRRCGLSRYGQARGHARHRNRVACGDASGQAPGVELVQAGCRPDRADRASQGAHPRQGGTPVSGDQAPVRAHESALLWPRQECGAVVHAVCAVESVDGSPPNARHHAMSASVSRSSAAQSHSRRASQAPRIAKISEMDDAISS